MNFFLSKDPKPHSKNRNLKNNYSICKIPSSAYKLGVTWILVSLARTSLRRLQFRPVSVLFFSLKDALPEQKQ